MKLNSVNSLKNQSFRCIYLWNNLINGKVYVGQTNNFYNRMCQYKKGKFNPHMGAAVEKYGIDNFDIIILEHVADKNRLNEREQYWIDFYKSYDRGKGYNICQVANSTLGYNHTPETIQKIRDKAIERFSDPEEREKYSGKNNSMYGVKHSEEWRKEQSSFMIERWKDIEYQQQISTMMSGENNPMFGRKLNGELNGMYGKHHSEESKRKISEKRKGKSCPSSLKRAIRCVETGEIFDSLTSAGVAVGTNASAIWSACNGRTKKIKGFHWEYVDK